MKIIQKPVVLYIVLKAEFVARKTLRTAGLAILGHHSRYDYRGFVNTDFGIANITLDVRKKLFERFPNVSKTISEKRVFWFSASPPLERSWRKVAEIRPRPNRYVFHSWDP